MKHHSIETAGEENDGYVFTIDYLDSDFCLVFAKKSVGRSNDRPKSFWISHFQDLVGKWPVADCYL